MSGSQAVDPSDVSFGVGLFPWGKEPPEFEDLVRVTQRAEELGYDAVHVPFHLIFPSETWIFPDFENHYLLDCYTLVTGLAARTDDIGVAINSIVPTMYNPYMNARIVTTLDHMTGGRIKFGVAPGWIEEEFDIMNEPYEGRVERMEDHVDAMLDLFTEETVDFRWGDAHIEDLRLEPKPVQDPYPEIWYGGSSRGAVRRSAGFADVLCLYCKDLRSRELIGERIAPDLAADSAEHGREGAVDLGLYTFTAAVQDEAEREHMHDILMHSYEGWSGEGNEYELSLVGDPAECIEGVERFAEAGISEIVCDLNSHGLEDLDTLERRLVEFKEQVIDEL